MRGTKLSAARSSFGIAVIAGALIATTAGFTARPAATKREVITIVNTVPGPRHARVTAKGAFDAHGYFVRKKASLVFPHGRIFIKRHLTGTTYSPPDLATCSFKIRQKGTFRVVGATGNYRGLRFGGPFHTYVTGRLKRSGDDQCSSKIVFYRAVTYEIGTVADA
jgi:hypothetical protein